MRLDVRRIGPSDSDRYRAVRLAALSESPEAFASTYADEAALPLERWSEMAEERSDGFTSTIFLATDATGATVGLAGAYRPDPGRNAVDLVSMWVDPTVRGTGLGERLIGAVLGWAAEGSFGAVELCVRRNNRAARALYERLGFRQIDQPDPDPSDPLAEDRMRLELVNRGS